MSANEPATTTAEAKPLTAEQKQQIAELLNRLTEVCWDRCVVREQPLQMVTCYGWIDRSDQHIYHRKDFIVVFWTPEGIGFTTSSAKYSRSISERLLGTSENHADCQKIASVFGDAVDNTTAGEGKG